MAMKTSLQVHDQGIHHFSASPFTVLAIAAVAGSIHVVPPELRCTWGTQLQMFYHRSPQQGWWQQGSSV